MIDNPLVISKWSKHLKIRYSKEAFNKINYECKPEHDDLDNFVRSWIMEGIPYCFNENPILYEKIRKFLANQIDINQENVHLCGSAKIGFSFSPKKCLDNYLPSRSDLDIFIISDIWFKKFLSDYRKFTNFYDLENKNEITDIQKKYINDNIETLEGRFSTIKRGFIDNNKIPYLRNKIFGDNLKKCNKALDDLVKFLKDDRVKFVYAPEKITLRIYNNYDNALKQIKKSIQNFINRKSQL